MSKLAVLLGTTLVLFQLTALSFAKNGDELADSNPPYPGDSQIVFEWEYSCSDGQGCSFTCPDHRAEAELQNYRFIWDHYLLGAINVLRQFFITSPRHTFRAATVLALAPESVCYRVRLMG